MEIAQLFGSGKSLALSLGLLATAGMTGCQSDANGKAMPSAYSSHDDIQYYPPGPEFKLSKEAAALEAYRRESGMQPMDPQASQGSKSACSCASCSRGAMAQTP